MPWNSTWPVGSTSVKNNKLPGTENTTYIETTMGNSIVGTNTVTTRDHFWNVGANEDGRHRFMQSPGFTVGGNPEDPVLGTGMDGVLYLKSDGLSPARVVGFYRNSSKIYQYIPVCKTGSVTLAPFSSIVPPVMVNMVSVPDNCYGEIFMYNTNGSPTTNTYSFNAQTGFFFARDGVVQAWSLKYMVEGSSSSVAALKFANGSDASGLNIRVQPEDINNSHLSWNYIVTYRALI